MALDKNYNIKLKKLDVDMAYKIMELIDEGVPIYYSTVAGYFNLRADFIAENLGRISTLSMELGLPPISGNVVNKISKQPGDKFFDVVMEFDRYKNDDDKSKAVTDAQECKDWSKLKKYLDENYNRK